MNLLRTLYTKTVAIVCFITVLLLLSNGIQGQVSQSMLRVSFNDGTNALIEMSEELRIVFDTDQIRFVTHKENDHVFSLTDVKKFEYSLDNTAIPTVENDSEIVHFTTEGFTITTNAGKHTCRIFSASGATVLSESFECSLFISADQLPSGTIFVQIDRNKILKFVVR